MNRLFYILLLLVFSCIPDMHEGPEPHSTEFNEASFNKINTYLISKDFSFLNFEKKEGNLPEDISTKISNNGFLTFYNIENKCQIYICGYGILDQPQWGFVFGDLSFYEKELSSTLADYNYQVEFTNLMPLKSNWYRFSGHITESLRYGYKTNNYLLITKN